MKTNENFQLSTFNFQPDKRLAVVILNWNGRALMEEFLPSVVACTPGEWADVIVADNGSTDDSIEMLKTKFPTVGIIRLDKNYGFAEGYNQALKHIGHEYTVLLNSDVEVTPGWLDAPIAALDADKTIAGVQPKIRAQRNKEYFEYAGAAGGYMDRYGYPYCRGRVLHVVEKDAGQYDTPADLLWATGACLFVRTATYKEVGGLDAGFFAPELFIKFHRIVRTSPGEYIFPESFGFLRIENISGFLECSKSICIQHFCPGVGIVACRITSVENMSEIRTAVADGDFRY